MQSMLGIVGPLTVTPDYEAHVSRHVHDDFDNGRVYAYQGKKLTVALDSTWDQPSRDLSGGTTTACSMVRQQH